MAEIKDATGAPTPVKLHTGEVVIASPLSQRDLITIVKKIRATRLKESIEAIPRDLPENLFKDLYREAVREANHIDIEEAMNNSLDMADVEIVTTIITLSLRKNQPNFTSGKIDEIIDNNNDLNAIMNAINSSEEVVTDETSAVEDDKKK